MIIIPSELARSDLSPMDYHRAAWPAPVRVLRHLPSVRTQSKIGHFRVTTGHADAAA